MNNQQNSLGQRIKEYLRKHNLSITGFSVSVPCSTQTVSKLIAGGSLRNKALIERITAKLDEPADALFEELLAEYRSKPVIIENRKDVFRHLAQLDQICKTCTLLPAEKKYPSMCQKACRFGIINDFAVGDMLNMYEEAERALRDDRMRNKPEWHLSRGFEQEKGPDVGASDLVAAL